MLNSQKINSRVGIYKLLAILDSLLDSTTNTFSIMTLIIRKYNIMTPCTMATSLMILNMCL
jgi:hypothetical protein